MGFNGEPSDSDMEDLYSESEEEEQILNVDDMELVNATDGVDEQEDSDEVMSENVEEMEEIDDEFITINPDFDNSAVTFNGHLGPVDCCVFHPEGQIVASGCEEEMLFVWNTTNKDVLLLEKFKDTVTLISFNHDGKYLAAVDMLGNFGCWKFSDNQYTQIKSMKVKCPSWMEWHPQANVLVLSEKTHFCMWKIPSFEPAKYFMLDSFSEAGCLMPDGKHALIGYDEGHAHILDLSTFKTTAKLKHRDKTSIDHGVVSVDAHPDNNVVALGSKNGRILLFTSKHSPKMIGTLIMPTVENGNYIECVKFGRDTLSGLLLVLYNNRFHIYDQSRLVIRHQLELTGHGIRMVCVEPYIYIATGKAIVEIIDCRSGLKKQSLQGHTKPIMDIALTKDKKKLMTSSDDTTVKIFYLDSLTL